MRMCMLHVAWCMVHVHVRVHVHVHVHVHVTLGARAVPMRTMTEGSSCTWCPRTLLMKLRMLTPARPWPTSRSAFISNIFSVTW